MDKNILYNLFIYSMLSILSFCLNSPSRDKIHPMLMSLGLLFYTTILSYYLNLYFDSYWYSYIIFLIMVGGMMILIAYFTSLVNNQMFMLTKQYLMILLMKVCIIYLFTLLVTNFDISTIKNYRELLNLKFLLDNKKIHKILMMDYSMDVNLSMICYLFFGMVCCVLICIKVKIPLRKSKK